LIAIGDYTTCFTGDYDGPHSWQNMLEIAEMVEMLRIVEMSSHPIMEECKYPAKQYWG